MFHNHEESIQSAIIRSRLPLLLEGETGTGKTTLARKVHESSGAKGKFVALNLSSFSSHLVESEVFGHLKGAFTGAIQDKKGAIALSENGTLFLDEIDSLSLNLQTKLLTFLDNGIYRPVGGDYERKVQTRLICASGKNLVELVRKGEMRKDFFFRIQSGITLKMYALRSRPESLNLFLHRWQEEEGVHFSKELREFYQRYDWPGNFRQLSSHLRLKKAVSSSAYLKLDDLDLKLLELDFSEREYINKVTSLSLEEVKKSYCQKIYREQGFNLQKSIDILKVSRNTLKKILSCDN